MAQELEIETIGVKKKINRIVFTIRIDEDMMAHLYDYQEKNHMNRSVAVRTLITIGLKNE